MECRCENDHPEDAGWLGGNSVQMGTFTVVGYLLYRFSQTLPALIRWPIRLFCSLTGLSALWGWVSRLVGTLRVIKSLCKWLSQVWKFLVACSAKFKWLGDIIRKITGTSNDEALESETDPNNPPGLRLILLGPTNEGRFILSNTLLGISEIKEPMGPLMESTRRKTILNVREVTVINTPDILGPSLESQKRAREALRSLQLATPGPHAFLLLIQASGPSMEMTLQASKAIQATRELFGDEALEFILPVLTNADHQGRKRAVEKLLDADSGGLKRALSLCKQRPELVNIRPDCPLEEQGVTCRQLLRRVMEMKTLRGHFVHELQRREDQRREELLADMTSALAQKLGYM
ncbi:GTPase IMAP family member 8-like isoform X2 [Cheilinus undulatus]|uniref:GTPase IMAP family member 8-like isoform X2 n=1 Tax=Cheilinus undulatus TaxID=241271 RepID=UPI001BD5E8AE|nr:GTPase IMAP family member 8-like isoform X2 [Cheilinus undulatus]